MDLSSLDTAFLTTDTLDLGTITVKNDVLARDRLGQFVFHLQEIHARSTEEALVAGTAAAIAAAPKKTGRMASTIHYTLLNPKEGEVSVGTSHWRYSEFGTAPHLITGDVSFFWTREGRRWNPGKNMISHPGSMSKPFMRIGYEVACDTLKEAMSRNYRMAFP